MRKITLTLFGSLALLLLGISGPAAAEVRKFEMTIEEIELEVAPGPLIHVTEGDHVEVTVHNLTTLNHTIHWHGVYQTNSWKSDGVPDVTQLGIQPGESFTYKFVADKVGTLWYHCHVNVAEHVGLRGMWGPLIVEPKKPSKLEKRVTKDAILMFSGWNSEVADTYGTGGKPGEVINYFSINGKSFPTNQPIRVKEGDVLRMRLIAASIPVAFHLHGHDMLVTHKDGIALKHPYPADVVPLSPGERIDVIVEMNNPGIWMTHDHIDHHTTNNGKEHGGSMLVVEYEGIEPEDFYHWKDIKSEPDFYMIESMAKPKGIHDIEVHKGKLLD